MAVRVKYRGGGVMTEVFRQAVGYTVENDILELHRKKDTDDKTEAFMVWAPGVWMTAELIDNA